MIRGCDGRAAVIVHFGTSVMSISGRSFNKAAEDAEVRDFCGIGFRDRHANPARVKWKAFLRRRHGHGRVKVDC